MVAASMLAAAVAPAAAAAARRPARVCAAAPCAAAPRCVSRPVGASFRPVWPRRARRHEMLTRASCRARSAAAAAGTALRASRTSPALAARALAGASAGAARRAASLVPRASAPSAVPTPVVNIDNLSDPLATVVEVSFGDLLGELLDTVRLASSAKRPRRVKRAWAPDRRAHSRSAQGASRRAGAAPRAGAARHAPETRPARSPARAAHRCSSRLVPSS